MYHDDIDGDYLDPIDRDPSDYDDASNDWWGDDDQEPAPGDTESDLEPDEGEDLGQFWRRYHDHFDNLAGLAEAERFMEAGLACW